MRLHAYCRWVILSVFVLMAARVQSQELTLACFNGTTNLDTNPATACPGGMTKSFVKTFTAGATDQVTFTNGNPAFGRPSFNTFTLTKERDAASDVLLKALYAQNPLPTVVIAGYSALSVTGSRTRTYTILMTNAEVTKWTWSATSDGVLGENIEFTFQKIAILNNITGQTVGWSPASTPAK
jgi:type VI protein secretion system component Hcp